MAIIGLSISDEHLEHDRDVRPAKELLQCIVNIFERQTLLNRLAARRLFYTATKQEDENILAFTNRIRQLSSVLKSMGVDIDDKEIAMAVLNGLPERFSSLLSALDAPENEDKAFSLDFVKSCVLQEDQRIEMRTRAPSTKSETSTLYFLHVEKQARIPQLRKLRKSRTSVSACLGEISRACFRDLDKAK